MIFIAVVLTLVSLNACTGDRGPMGPEGPVGEQGPAGPQGPAGQPLDWAEVLRQTALDAAVYAIGFRVHDSDFLIGTGFRAHFADVLWTNAHVVEGLTEALSTLSRHQPVPFATRTGTRIGGDDTHILHEYVAHPEYDGSALSPDVALLFVESSNRTVPALLPRRLAQELAIGQPIATMGFPHEIEGLNTTVPIATFKDGTVSAMRPYDPESTAIGPETNRFLQHNLDLSSGTSGSPIFDHDGWIIAINNAGTERLVIDEFTGRPQRIAAGNIGFGIRIDDAWELIDLVSGAAKRLALGAGGTGGRVPELAALRQYPFQYYVAFPEGWDGRVMPP